MTIIGEPVSVADLVDWRSTGRLEVEAASAAGRRRAGLPLIGTVAVIVTLLQLTGACGPEIGAQALAVPSLQPAGNGLGPRPFVFLLPR